MEIVQDTLAGLSQSLAGLMLAALVVFLVLLTGFIIFRKGHKKPAPPEKAEEVGEAAQVPAKEGKVVDLAKKRDDPAERARRFESLAATALEEGRLGEAADLFQKALAVSSENGVTAVSANARFELGNLAKARSDLLSACENWQLARSLYEEMGDKRKVRELDSIMADSQCPSDWVLNKF